MKMLDQVAPHSLSSLMEAFKPVCMTGQVPRPTCIKAETITSITHENLEILNHAVICA